MSFPPFLPYPPPRYDRADGEVSATLRRATAEPELVYPGEDWFSAQLSP